MSHIALYRAWRPQRFDEVVGQDPIIQTLKNALSEERLTHAYLFNGPRGTGKTTIAKILAKAVNCLRGPAPEPCNDCEACLRISDGTVMDVIELDAASNNGVDEIRDIRDKVKYAPTEVRYKVYIIDEVHMLTIGAFNALLKTLEEPPAHVIFILATTEPHKLPVTIISRCQRYDFRRVSLDALIQRLSRVCEAEGIEIDSDALGVIARLADGGARDALSLLDQIIAFTGTKVTRDDVVAITGSVTSELFVQIAESAANGDAGSMLTIIERLMAEGRSAERCLDSCMTFYRDALMAKLVGSGSHDPEVTRVADLYSKEQLFRAIEILNRASSEMKYAVHPGTMLEVALLQLCVKLVESPAEREAAPASQPAVSMTVRADSEAVSRLEGRVAELEARLASIASSGGAGQSGADNAELPRNREKSKSQATKSGGPRSKTSLAPFIGQADSAAFTQLKTRWAQVLSGVKNKSISLSAWLVNGEPVAATDDAVLVAFKNSIHRETTDKPDNRQAIEQVLGEVYGKPLALRTAMLKDWSDAVEIGKEKDSPEPLQLVPESSDNRHQEDWINEAIDLFGEDMVVIRED